MSRLKAPYRCHHCGKNFTIEGEEIYNINNTILTESDIDSQLHWRWINEEQDHITTISYFFHRECFSLIAGDGYLSQKRK